MFGRSNRTIVGLKPVSSPPPYNSTEFCSNRTIVGLKPGWLGVLVFVVERSNRTIVGLKQVTPPWRRGGS